MRWRRALAVAFALVACRNFDEALDECYAEGTCFDADAGAAGGGTSGGTGGGAGGTAGAAAGGVGGGPAGGTAGGQAGGAAGGATAGGRAGGSGGTAGGTAGGMVGPNGWGISVPATLVAAPGAIALAELDVIRPQFDSTSVDLVVTTRDGGPINLAVDFTSDNGYVTRSTMMVWAPFPWDGGALELSVQAYVDEDVALLAEAPFTLTWRAPAPTLLVDDSDVGGNQAGSGQPAYSSEDRAFIDVLTQRGIAFDRFVHPQATDGGEMTAPLINAYGQVIWYTGDTWAGWSCFPEENEAVVDQWLRRGGKKLVLVSSGYFHRVADESWSVLTNDFVRDQLGGAGTRYRSWFDIQMVRRFAGPGVNVPFGNSSYQVGFLNPRPGTQVLFTEVVPDSGMPVVTRNVTDAGSIVVFSGFGLIEVLNPDAGGTQREVVRVLLDAGGFQ